MLIIIRKGIQTHWNKICKYKTNKIQSEMENPCSSNVPLKNPIQNSHVPTTWMTLLGETQHAQARDHNRPLGPRHGR
jgi:hypothetical protein